MARILLILVWILLGACAPAASPTPTSPPATAVPAAFSLGSAVSESAVATRPRRSVTGKAV